MAGLDEAGKSPTGVSRNWLLTTRHFSPVAGLGEAGKAHDHRSWLQGIRPNWEHRHLARVRAKEGFKIEEAVRIC